MHLTDGSGLYQRLDFYVDPQFKGRHVKALIKLSESSGTFPQCLVLSDVSLEDEPVAGGGFGDVFRGRLRGHEIAVKVLKVYKMSVVENLLRVPFLSSCNNTLSS